MVSIRNASSQLLTAPSVAAAWARRRLCSVTTKVMKMLW
jgi:hypothetical protein